MRVVCNPPAPIPEAPVNVTCVAELGCRLCFRTAEGVNTNPEQAVSTKSLRGNLLFPSSTVIVMVGYDCSTALSSTLSDWYVPEIDPDDPMETKESSPRSTSLLLALLLRRVDVVVDVFAVADADVVDGFGDVSLAL